MAELMLYLFDYRRNIKETKAMIAATVVSRSTVVEAKRVVIATAVTRRER